MQDSISLVPQILSAPDVNDIMNDIKIYDETTYKHCINVAKYSEALINSMEIDNIYKNSIITGALFHDYGKIFVPKDILNKPERLTAREFNILKKHSELGYRCLADKYNDVVLNIIRFHHEKGDGSGYPLGLSKEEIPLEVSIVTICDIFDAMTSKRVYKKPLSYEFVMRELYTDALKYKLDAKIIDILAYTHKSINN